MLSLLPHARLRPSRSALVALALAASMAGAVAVAYQAYRTEEAQRRVVTKTLRDYVQFASYIYDSRMYLFARDRALEAFSAVSNTTPAALPPVSVIPPNIGSQEVCADSVHAKHFRFRLTLPDKKLSMIGRPVSPAVQARLVDTLAKLSKRPMMVSWGFGVLFTDAGLGEESVIFAPVFDETDKRKGPIALYGYSSCFATSDSTTLPLMYRIVHVLPPSLSFEYPPDSLVAITVWAPDGRVLYKSPAPVTDSTFTATYYIAPLGNIKFTTVLQPKVFDPLTADGFSKSRMPTSYVLVTLSVILALGGFILFRTEEHSMRQRSRFLANVSHELRTPLQQILLFVQLLRLGKQNEAQRAQALRIVDTETQRLIMLTENVLEFSRGSREMKREPADAAQLVRDVVTLLEPLAAKRGMTLTASGEPAMLQVNAHALRQILINLIDNAVKYGPKGQTIEVSVAATDDDVAVSVADEGPGIPSADRERIWEPYVRLDRRDDSSSGGAGIGLSVARELVGQMEGAIAVQPTASGGSRFVVTLPRGEWMADVLAPAGRS